MLHLPLKNILILSLSLSASLLAINANAESFKLYSSDIIEGEFMSKTHEFKGFGCDGGDQSPQLSWSGAPQGTKAYAVMMHDPDAPTGSGWWHWQLVNIPKKITVLPTGFNSSNVQKTEIDLVNIKNDYGNIGYGGACPPKGDGAHRYQFTVYALGQTLELPQDASSALTSYMVKSNALASSTIEALYKRR